MHPQITVVIPSLPARHQMLRRAVQSVGRQTLSASGLSIAIDTTRAGAAATRQRALMGATSCDWVAFLDDDDVFKADHLRLLYDHAMVSGADYVYSWFDMTGGVDPFPETHRTQEFDPANPTETTITTMVRRELAQAVGFKPLDRGHDTNSGEDFGFTLGCLAAGGKISHLIGHRTWFYNVHGDGKGSGNTSGLPTKGDATLWTPSES